jgi:23S rRNA pseudouridine1911/1915/1917 synthase
LILDVIAKRDGWLVVNKPPNLHSTDRSEGGPSIAALIARDYPECRDASPHQEDCGLVNRLDYGTSGLLIAARSRKDWELLHSLFTGGRVEKEYLVLLEGRFEGPILVENYLGTPHRGAKKVKVYTAKPPRRARALPAATAFRSLRYDPESNATAAGARTYTGRRHQVRAHAAFLGHPLLGDHLYGATTPCPLPRPFFLHAAKLCLTLPDGTTERYYAPPGAAESPLFPLAT